MSSMMEKLYKSVLDQDRAAVVLCDLDHIIVYMNEAAGRRYEKDGGLALVGKTVMSCHNQKSQEMIKKIVAWFADSKDHNMIHTFYNKKENKDVYMVALRDEDGTLIGYYEKHEYRNPEAVALYDFTHPIM